MAAKVKSASPKINIPIIFNIEIETFVPVNANHHPIKLNKEHLLLFNKKCHIFITLIYV